MKSRIGQKRRITLPLDLLNKIGLNEGDDIQIYVEDDKLVITKDTINNQTNYIDEQLKTVKTECSVHNIDKKDTIRSNIQDINKYCKPYISKCGLVVRSKQRYVDTFCELCKGKLVKNNEECDCIFNTHVEPKQELKPEVDIQTPVETEINIQPEVQTETNKEIQTELKSKDVIHNIKINTRILQQHIDDKIRSIIPIEHKDTDYDKLSDKVLEPVYQDGKLKACTNCKELFTKGFLLDGYFYCKSCAKEDFINYYNQIKKGMEE